MKKVNQITNLEELMKKWIKSECWKRNEKNLRREKLSVNEENTNEKNKVKTDENYEIGSIFIEDGIVNSKLYNKQPRKILFILKEAYVVPEERKCNHSSLLNDFYKDGVARNFWNRIAEWSVGILNTTSENIISIDEIKNNIEIKKKAIERVALINLKKSDGNKDTDMNEFEKYFFMEQQEENEKSDKRTINKINEYKDYLIRQIELIDPDVIICCGTFDIFRKIIDEKDNTIITNTKLDRNFNFRKKGKDKEAILIKYVHPSYRIPLDLLYYGLISTYQQILKL